MKKILSLVLAVAILICAVPMGAFTLVASAETETEYTEGYYTYRVDNGEATITYVDRAISGDITIPAYFGDYPVVSICVYAFEECHNLTSVIIPDTVISIGYMAFYGCENLKSVNISNSVNYIGNYAFAECSKLESFTIPYNVTNISFSTFADCTSLKSVVLSDVSTVDENAFWGCTALEDVWYTGFKEDVYICTGNEALENATWHCEVCLDSPALGSHSFENNICVYCQKKEMLIASIVIDNKEISIIENTCGYYDDEYGYHFYDLGYGGKSPEYTVILKDGTSVKSQWNSVIVNGDQFHLYSDTWYSQSQAQWTVGNTYDVSCRLENWDNPDEYVRSAPITSNFKVSIVETPIAKIEINDVTVTEYTNGYFDNDVYYYNEPTFSGVITYKNGDTEEFDGGIEIYDDWFWVISNIWDLQNIEPWTVGTYEVTGTVMGVSDTFNFTITESPVKSIEIYDVSIIEYSNGDYDGEDYYYHQPSLSGKVTMSDGTTTEFVGGFYIGDEWFGIDVDFSSQYEEPWVAGNAYTVIGTCAGVSDTFNITITETPVKSIQIDDFKIIEYSNGYYYEGDFYYYYPTLSGTVTFKDGTTQKFTGSFEFEDVWYSVYIKNWDELQENFVTGNKYEGVATVLGVSDSFNITIEKSPIKSMKLEDIVLYEGIDSYHEDDYDVYSFSTVLSEVIFNDGTKAAISDGSFYYENCYYYVDDNSWDLQSKEPWTVGEYTVTATIFGVSADFKVTILPNPIEELKIINMPQKTEYLHGEYFNVKGLAVRIMYADGSYEDVSIDTDYTSAYGRYYYSEKLDRNQYIYFPSQADEIGNVSFEFYLFGKICYIPVVVKENKITSVAVKENDDKSITVTMNNTDSSYDMKLLDLDYAYELEEDVYGTTIFTDKGSFSALIYADENSFAIGIYDFSTDEYIKSNTISNSEWFEVASAANYYSSDLMYFSSIEDVFVGDHFDGKITSENVEDIIWFASISAIEYEKWGFGTLPSGEEYMYFSGDDVRDAVYDVFGIKDIDLTRSFGYDSAIDTYTTTKVMHGTGGMNKTTPSKMTYNDGVWIIESMYPKYEYSSDTGEVGIYLKLNGEQKIVAYELDGNHLFDNANDNECNVCGEKRDVNSWEIYANSTGIYNITPNKTLNGFTRDSITVVDEQFNVVKYNEIKKGWPLVSGQKYTVILDEGFSNVENLSWTLSKQAETIFPDTDKNGWYNDAVTYAVGAGIISGYQNGKFGTSDSIQRQDFLVMLARYEGVDLSEYNYKSKFSDVARDSYYEAAVNWGAQNGIVTGYDNGKFGVGDKVTREQLVTFLYRYAKYKGINVICTTTQKNSVKNTYSDYKNVSPFAQDAIVWAVTRGVIGGKTPTTIVPQGNAQRCEVAKIMYNIYLNDVF